MAEAAARAGDRERIESVETLVFANAQRILLRDEDRSRRNTAR
jgi:hypothetical protein